MTVAGHDEEDGLAADGRERARVPTLRQVVRRVVTHGVMWEIDNGSRHRVPRKDAFLGQEVKMAVPNVVPRSSADNAA